MQAFAGLAQKSAGATEIAIVAAKSKVTLSRDDKGEWHVAECGGLSPAKPDMVRRLMVDLETMDLLEKRSSRDDAQQAMGLSSPEKGGPGISVTVTDNHPAPCSLPSCKARSKITAPAPSEARSMFAFPVNPIAGMRDPIFRPPTDPTGWVSKQIMEIPRNRIAEAVARPGAADRITAKAQGSRCA